MTGLICDMNLKRSLDFNKSYTVVADW